MSYSSYKRFRGFIERKNNIIGPKINPSGSLVELMYTWKNLIQPKNYQLSFWRTPNKKVTFTYNDMINSVDFTETVISACNPSWANIDDLKRCASIVTEHINDLKN